MSRKLKILVSCYACSPDRGSEPGMGWHFVKGLSDYHEVHVIVEKRKWEQPIKAYLEAHPKCKQNLKFYFIDKKRLKTLRKIWPPSYYWFYKQWQQKAYALAIALDKTENFDLIHQLNMVGYREPGYLWQIQKPFVWGPIGGLENTPWKFLPELGLKGMLHFTGRNIINWIQKNYASRPRKAALRNNKALIAATKANQLEIAKLWGQKSIIITEVGQVKNTSVQPIQRTDDKLNIVWSGVHEPRKNLGLLLKALAHVDVNYELHILGEGEETVKWKKLSKALEIADNCTWYGWLPLQKSLQVLSKGHLFCITSIHDLTSTVILEAISYGLPVICLNLCGFSNVINDNCGIKIPANHPVKAKEDFASAIEHLYSNESLRYHLAQGALERSKDFNWEQKIKKLNAIYKDLVT